MDITPSPTRQTQILVVEDEPIVSLDLQQRLEKMGYRVPVVVASGEEAIESTQDSTPDLVLMDINLHGEMDGVEAAEQIRARHQVPVVYLTAYSNDQTLSRAKTTEPFGYLLKPFEERELQTTIEIALHKHQAEQALQRAHDELERRVSERTIELRNATSLCNWKSRSDAVARHANSLSSGCAKKCGTCAIAAISSMSSTLSVTASPRWPCRFAPAACMSSKPDWAPRTCDCTLVATSTPGPVPHSRIRPGGM